MEDEDLELLRIAALKSLHTKAKPQENQRPVEKIQPVQAIQPLNPRAVPFIPTQQGPPPQPWNNFGPQPTPVVVPQMHYVPPVVRIPGPGPGLIPLQQPNFMPNMMPTPPGVPINVPLSIVPVVQPSNIHVPNVQLSPRSAAFVSQVRFFF